MADIYWKIPLAVYPEICSLLWECAQADLAGERETTDELRERIRLLPNFPTHYNHDYDVIYVVPKDARITITPDRRRLPGLP